MFRLGTKSTIHLFSSLFSNLEFYQLYSNFFQYQRSIIYVQYCAISTQFGWVHFVLYSNSILMGSCLLITIYLLLFCGSKPIYGPKAVSDNRRWWLKNLFVVECVWASFLVGAVCFLRFNQPLPGTEIVDRGVLMGKIKKCLILLFIKKILDKWI